MQPTRGVSSNSATCCSHAALQCNRNCLAEARDTGYRGHMISRILDNGGEAECRWKMGEQGDRRQEA